jgi:hypothetical protein
MRSSRADVFRGRPDDALGFTVRLWEWRLRILDTVPCCMLRSREISFWVKPARRKPTICHPMRQLYTLNFDVIRYSAVPRYKGQCHQEFQRA